MNEIDSYKLSIQEIQDHFKRQIEGLDVIKSFAKTILGAASIIVALLSTLRIFYAAIAGPFVVLYNFVVILVMLLYTGLIALCLIVLAPTKLYGPVVPDWSKLYEAYFKENEIENLKTQLSAYFNAISLNEKIIHKYFSLARLAAILLVLIVVFLLALGLIPK